MNNPRTAPPPAPAASGDGRSVRWDAHRQARRIELVKAARKAVHRLGPAASMEDFAAAAGTSKSVFYRYFGDKEGLRRAMGEIVIGQMRSKVLDAARYAANEEEGLRAMVGAYLHTAQTSPNVYFFVTAIGRDPLSLAEAATGAGNPAGTEPLDDFFVDITAMMGESMRAYIGAGSESSPEGTADGHPASATAASSDTAPGRTTPGGTAPASPASANTALSLWPRASIGMVRAAGESWLRLPPGPSRPSEGELTNTITEWLVAGISASAGRHRKPPPSRRNPRPSPGTAPGPPTTHPTTPEGRHTT